MKYESCPYDPEHFATALKKDSHAKKLTWDSARGQDVIIVQTAFGVNAAAIMDELCVALNHNEQPLNDYVEVMDSVWVCYVSAADKARNNGCRLNGEASTYTVFSCQKEGELCKIYQPQNQSMLSQSYNIPLEIHAIIQKEMHTKGFLRHREVDTGFYSIAFPDGLAAEYMDGSLCYKISDLEIPVTKEMLEQKIIYIKTDVRPELIPKNNGLKIV